MLIRHGLTLGNERGAYIGKTDETLSNKGVAAIRQAAAEGFYPIVDKLFISPMKRCRQTAEIIYPGIDPVEISGFAERDFGRYEGKSFAELKDDPEYMSWVHSGGSLPFPDGEMDEAFRERVTAAYRRLLREDAKDDTKRIGIIAHGGTIMTIMHCFYDHSSSDLFAWHLYNGDYYLVPELIKREIRGRSSAG